MKRARPSVAVVLRAARHALPAVALGALTIFCGGCGRSGSKAQRAVREVPGTPSMRVVSDGLEIVVTEARPDVFRFVVRPAAGNAPKEIVPLLGAAHSAVLFDPHSGAIAIQYDSRARWWGRIRPVGPQGRTGTPGLETSWRAVADEAIYGLGERFDALNQYGRKVEMWNVDAAAQGGSNSCCTVPVVFSTAGYALFTEDNPEGYFDFDVRGDGLHRHVRTGSEMALYVAAGAGLADLLQKRAAVLKAPAAFPSWAWGPWISRGRFENQADAEDVLNGMIQRELPVAAVVIEGWKGAAEAGDFSAFPPARWPAPERYLDLCRKHGVRNLLWQTPFLPAASPPYEDFRRCGYFVRRAVGFAHGLRNEADAPAYIDLTNPRAVAAWQDLMRPALLRGIGGFKIDGGEGIEPDDVFANGRRGWQLHNDYAALLQRTLVDLLDEEGVAGVVWSSGGSAGSQSVAALRAGDQWAEWDALRSLVPAGLSAGMSGIVYWGHDIGGCFGEPLPELYIRWLQLGALSPVMQYHGVARREPWDFGDVAEDSYRLLVNLRMNLRPTLEELAGTAQRSGLPIMRPMILQFPDDPRFAGECTQYMLGPDLLVAPVLEEDAAGRSVCFPSGTWQHVFSPMAFQGPATFNVPIGLVDAPLFLREGAELEVQMARDAWFGEWSPKDPVRRVRIEPERATVRDLRAPLRGNPLMPEASLAFRPNAAAMNRMSGVWYFADQPAVRHAASWMTNGAELVMTVRPEGETALLGRSQAYAILERDSKGAETEVVRGEIRWRSPVSLTLKCDGSRVVREDLREIVLQLRNDGSGPLDLAVRAGGTGGVRVRPWAQTVTLPAGCETGLQCAAEFQATNAVGEAKADFSVRSGGLLLEQCSIAFARLPRWIVVGPFFAGRGGAYRTAFAPEWNFSPDVSFETEPGAACWTALDERHWPDRGCLDFGALFGGAVGAAGYAMTKIYSDAERTCELRFRTDDALEVRLNGVRVHVTGRGAAGREEDVVTARLEQGVNTLLVKTVQSGVDWRLEFRLTGLDGQPAIGMRDGWEDYGRYAADRARGASVTSRVAPFSWRILGPIPGLPREEDGWHLETDLMAESKTWPPSAESGAWRELQMGECEDNFVDLRRVLGAAKGAVAYAAATVVVPRRIPATLVCASDEGITVWLNGEKVWSADGERPFSYASDEQPVVLEAGTNRVLCRVSQAGGEWRFQLNFERAAESASRPVGGVW